MTGWRLPTPDSRRADRGFTLLEVLLAAILIGAIIGVAYEMYLGSMRSARRGTSEMAVYQAARALVQTMADDLRAAILTRGVFGFGLRGTDGGEEGLTGDVLELSCPGLVRWRADPEGFAPDPLPPLSDFRHITYRVLSHQEAIEETTEPEITPTWGLLREVRTNLTGQDADERDVQVLSRQVAWLDVQYFDGLDWLDDWDAGTLDLMPRAVRITLVVVPSEQDLLDEEAGLPLLAEEIVKVVPGARTFTTVVDLPTAAESDESTDDFTEPEPMLLP